MKFLCWSGIAVIVFASQLSVASQYKLDAAHSYIGFKIRHLVISKVKGQFKDFEGAGSYDEKTGKMSKLNVKIKASSIDTNETDRDKHLRGKDFFNVKKFSHITFKSTKVEYKGKKPTYIHGELNMRGVKKAVKLKVDEWGGTGTDPWGNVRVAFEASTKIDRRQFGLTWNKGLKKAAGKLVGDEVELVLNIQGVKQ